jgi:hypothetical protein
MENIRFNCRKGDKSRDSGNDNEDDPKIIDQERTENLGREHGLMTF